MADDEPRPDTETHLFAGLAIFVGPVPLPFLFGLVGWWRSGWESSTRG